MSNVIDNRVVEIGFDNRNFESNARTSTKTLEELKKGLNLEESAKGLSALTSAGKSFSLAGIADSVDSISGKFSAFGVIGFTVLQNLTNSAIAFGEKMVNALAIEPLKKGFQEYETQMGAIQTILANTSTKGTTLKQVNAALDELNAYSDKTIYNFTEMTKNIGTFTAAGIDLDKSVFAIKGIANLAAVSGSNSQQAATAMYQLSQALASGTVKLMDWNSVVNAGMGGQVFQDALKETARVHGIAIDNIIKKEGSFRESLSKGWLSSEILLETLSKFTGDMTADQLRAIGYTEEQIKAIVELGKMANDAATKVKTFSQLIETLQEAIQSGWGTTWRMVVGDFEEAKAFFTEVSDTLGLLIKDSANARNKLIFDWRKFGGRVALLDGIRNAFQGILSIIAPIKEAFEDIFPPITGQQLKMLTVGFRDLAAKLKIGADTAEKLKTIFHGVLSVFDIVFRGVSSLATTFLKLTGSVMPASGSVLDFLVNIAKYVSNLRDGIIANDTFNRSLAQVGLFLNTLVTNVKVFADKVSKAFTSFKQMAESNTLLTGLLAGLKDFFKGATHIFDGFEKLEVGKIFGGLVDRIKARLSGLQGIGDFLAPLFSGLGKKIGDAQQMSKSISGAISEFFKNIWNAIVQGLNKVDFSKIDFNGFFDTLNAGLLSALLMSINGFVRKGSGFFDGILDIFKGVKGVEDGAKGILDGVKGVLDGVRGSLEAWQQSLRAGILMKIAGAIAVLTISLIALSLVDSVKLSVAIGAITTMFADLMGSLAISEKVAGKGNMGGLAKAVTSMIALSAALLILSGALLILSKIDPQRLLGAVGAMTAMVVLLVGSAKILSDNSGGMTKSAIGMLGVTVSILLLTEAVKKLGDLDPARLTNGLIGVGVLLAEVMAFMKMTDMDTQSLGKQIGLMLFAQSIVLMAKSVDVFGKMDQTKLTQGLVTMGLILAAVATFVNTTGDAKNVVATAVGMAIMGGAMLIFARAVTQLSALTWDQLAVGLVGMGGALLIITQAMMSMPPNMLASAAGLVIVGGALLLISKALSSLGKMSWEELGIGLVALAGSMLILTVALNTMQGALPGAAALLVASAALAVFTPVLIALGAVPLAQIGVGLLALAGIFVVLGVAGYLLGPVVPVLLALAGVMGLFALAAIGVGVGLLAFSAGMAALAISGAAGSLAIVAIVNNLVGLIPVLVTAIAGGIVLFAKLIASSAPELCKALSETLLALIGVITTVTPALLDALTMLLLKLIDTVVTVVPKFVDAVLYLLDTLLKSIARRMPDFIQSGMDIIMAFLKGVRDNIGEMVTVAIEIVQKFLDAVAQKIPDLIDSGAKLILAFINGLTDGIDKYMPQINEAMGKLAQTMIDGLIQGLLGGVGQVGTTLAGLGEAALKALSESVDSHSPSRETDKIGRYMGQGLINGVLYYAKQIKSAAASIGDDAIAGLSSSISQVYNALSENMDMAPTIRPVVDLSDVMAGSKQANSLFAKTLNMSSSLDKVPDVRLKSDVSSGLDASNGKSGATQEINFTQNNYSPKELSTIEVYRNTQNQLRVLKGVLKPA